MSARAAGILLGVAVGLVLADSSIVTLALPEILREYDATVGDVAWVLTAFNLVLALAALPAAVLARGWRPIVVLRFGLVLFAVASAACALAPSLEVLVAARCVQAIGGAAAVCSALEVLAEQLGSEERAGRQWAIAGVIGAAIGPAAGGILTELINWQAIFVAQVPLALVALGARGAAIAPAAAHARARPGSADDRRAVARERRGPHVAANLALALVSAALTAALFLLVLLLIEGWGMSPAEAAVTVTVIPIAALVAGPLGALAGTPGARAGAGALLVAGGLAGLGLLPGAGWAWTVVPQALVGIGLGLSIAALTAVALDGRGPQAIHGGWTIAARHVGVVGALLLLTPIFTADLRRENDAAKNAGLSVLLDAPLDLDTKVAIGEAVADVIAGADGRIPDLGPAFASVEAPAEQERALAGLEDDLVDQIERAATHAFSRSFLVAAALALLGLAPIALLGRAAWTGRRAPPAAAASPADPEPAHGAPTAVQGPAIDDRAPTEALPGAADAVRRAREGLADPGERGP